MKESWMGWLLDHINTVELLTWSLIIGSASVAGYAAATIAQAVTR